MSNGKLIQISDTTWVALEKIETVEITDRGDWVWVGGNVFELEDEYYESVFKALGITKETDND